MSLKENRGTKHIRFLYPLERGPSTSCCEVLSLLDTRKSILIGPRKRIMRYVSRKGVGYLDQLFRALEFRQRAGSVVRN
jgi:hypothetical protein